MSRMVLLPGLAADERMFLRFGKPEFPLYTPRLPIPVKGEDLPSYARRVADMLQIDASDIIGGASFGSLVASAIARERKVRALVLIGGALSSDALRPVPGARMLHWLPGGVLKPMLRSDRALEIVFGPEDPEMKELARRMMADAPDALLLRGGRMMLDYRPPSAPTCPVFAIHGALDRVMSPPPVSGCRIIPEAGHGIAWTHAPAVGHFLREAWGTPSDLRADV
jgi:pimeloyl-ACP methyl ester carboxylesterase